MRLPVGYLATQRELEQKESKILGMTAHGRLIIALVAGCVPALFTLAIEKIVIPSSNPVLFAIQQVGIMLLFPGMFGSMAVSGNAHAFHLWVAAIWNFVFYFLVCLALVALIGRIWRRLTAA